jgi:Protein of unknown function (DUF1572)
MLAQARPGSVSASERVRGLSGVRLLPLAPRTQRMQNPGMPLEFTTSYLKDSTSLLRYYKMLGERAIAQVSDADLLACLDRESNSVAIIVKHLTGNMVSRWTDFLTTDGEKTTRNRDAEFETPPRTRTALLSLWETAWKVVFESLAPLTEEDMSRTVRIRGEAHSVMQAIHRQVAHYAYHVGQIVFLAKHLSWEKWTSLSIPRGKSSDFNTRVASGKVSQR